MWKTLKPMFYNASDVWVWISVLEVFTKQWVHYKLPYREEVRIKDGRGRSVADIFAPKWLYEFYWSLFYTTHTNPRNPDWSNCHRDCCSTTFECIKALCDDEVLSAKYASLRALDKTYPLEHEFFKDFPSFSKSCFCGAEQRRGHEVGC